MSTNLITAIDVASILQISKAHAYQLISQGLIPSVRFGKKTVRVKSEDLQRFIDDNTVNPVQQLSKKTVNPK